MEPLLRLFGVLLRAVAFFAMPLIGWYNRWCYKAITIPAIDDDLLLLSVVDLSDRIRTRRTSAVAAVTAYMRRIRQVDAVLNAVVEDRFEAALLEAARMDEMIAEAQPSQLLVRYPLCGVPFTVKESCSLKGTNIERTQRTLSLWCGVWCGYTHVSGECVLRVFAITRLRPESDRFDHDAGVLFVGCLHMGVLH